MLRGFGTCCSWQNRVFQGTKKQLLGTASSPSQLLGWFYTRVMEFIADMYLYCNARCYLQCNLYFLRFGEFNHYSHVDARVGT